MKLSNPTKDKTSTESAVGAFQDQNSFNKVKGIFSTFENQLNKKLNQRSDCQSFDSNLVDNTANIITQFDKMDINLSNKNNLPNNVENAQNSNNLQKLLSYQRGSSFTNNYISQRKKSTIEVSEEHGRISNNMHEDSYQNLKQVTKQVYLYDQDEQMNTQVADHSRKDSCSQHQTSCMSQMEIDKKSNNFEDQSSNVIEYTEIKNIGRQIYDDHSESNSYNMENSCLLNIEKNNQSKTKDSKVFKNTLDQQHNQAGETYELNYQNDTLNIISQKQDFVSMNSCVQREVNKSIENQNIQSIDIESVMHPQQEKSKSSFQSAQPYRSKEQEKQQNNNAQSFNPRTKFTCAQILVPKKEQNKSRVREPLTRHTTSSALKASVTIYNRKKLVRSSQATITPTSVTSKNSIGLMERGKSQIKSLQQVTFLAKKQSPRLLTLQKQEIETPRIEQSTSVQQIQKEPKKVSLNHYLVNLDNDSQDDQENNCERKQYSGQDIKQELVQSYQKVKLDLYSDILRIKKPQPIGLIAGQILCKVVNSFRGGSQKTNNDSLFKDWEQIQDFVHKKPNIIKFHQELTQLIQHMILSQDYLNQLRQGQLKNHLNKLIKINEQHFGNLSQDQIHKQFQTNKNLQQITQLCYFIVRYILFEAGLQESLNLDVVDKNERRSTTSFSNNRSSVSRESISLKQKILASNTDNSYKQFSTSPISNSSKTYNKQQNKNMNKTPQRKLDLQLQNQINQLSDIKANKGVIEEIRIQSGNKNTKTILMSPQNNSQKDNNEKNYGSHTRAQVSLTSQQNTLKPAQNSSKKLYQVLLDKQKQQTHEKFERLTTSSVSNRNQSLRKNVIQGSNARKNKYEDLNQVISPEKDISSVVNDKTPQKEQDFTFVQTVNEYNDISPIKQTSGSQNCDQQSNMRKRKTRAERSRSKSKMAFSDAISDNRDSYANVYSNIKTPFDPYQAPQITLKQDKKKYQGVFDEFNKSNDFQRQKYANTLLPLQMPQKVEKVIQVIEKVQEIPAEIINLIAEKVEESPVEILDQIQLVVPQPLLQQSFIESIADQKNQTQNINVHEILNDQEFDNESAIEDNLNDEEDQQSCENEVEQQSCKQEDQQQSCNDEEDQQSCNKDVEKQPCDIEDEQQSCNNEEDQQSCENDVEKQPCQIEDEQQSCNEDVEQQFCDNEDEHRHQASTDSLSKIDVKAEARRIANIIMQEYLDVQQTNNKEWDLDIQQNGESNTYEDETPFAENQKSIIEERSMIIEPYSLDQLSQAYNSITIKGLNLNSNFTNEVEAHILKNKNAQFNECEDEDEPIDQDRQSPEVIHSQFNSVTNIQQNIELEEQDQVHELETMKPQEHVFEINLPLQQSTEQCTQRTQEVQEIQLVDEGYQSQINCNPKECNQGLLNESEQKDSNDSDSQHVFSPVKIQINNESRKMIDFCDDMSARISRNESKSQCKHSNSENSDMCMQEIVSPFRKMRLSQGSNQTLNLQSPDKLQFEKQTDWCINPIQVKRSIIDEEDSQENEAYMSADIVLNSPEKSYMSTNNGSPCQSPIVQRKGQYFAQNQSPNISPGKLKQSMIQGRAAIFQQLMVTQSEIEQNSPSKSKIDRSLIDALKKRRLNKINEQTPKIINQSEKENNFPLQYQSLDEKRFAASKASNETKSNDNIIFQLHKSIQIQKSINNKM